MPLTAPTLLPASRFQRVALTLCLFLVIWGAKLFVIDQCGSDVPFWDQWAKEGEGIYPPFFERGELWRNVVIPHNEHRIAPTLLMNLGLIIAGGQWDARVQAIASGGVHAALLAGLFLWGARWLSRGWALAGALLLAMMGATPIAWENIVCGFQSQFYFLATFSLLALGGILGAPAFSLRWFGGVAAGFIAVVSMGSGFLCAAPIILVAGVRLLQRKVARRDALAALVAGLLIAGLGAFLHTSVPWHDAFHVRTAGKFLRYAAHCLAWPLSQHLWLALVIWLPWTVLLIRRCRVSSFPTPNPKLQTPNFPPALRAPSTRAESDPDPRVADLIIAAGLWVLVQVAAVAYSRGAAGDLPASRYQDLLGLGAAISFGALALLAPRWRRAWVLGAAWLAVVTGCVVVATREAWSGPLQGKIAEHRLYEHNVHQFVLSDDLATLENQTIPFPVVDWLARILRNQSIQRILPVSIRRPVAIEGLHQPASIPAPALTGRDTRALLAPGEWRSQPLPAGRGWWKIETTGHLGEPGALLQLIAVGDGRTLASISPSKPAGSAWRAAYVPAPTEPALLLARTDHADRWFAFSDPVEMSPLSYRLWRLGKYGAWIAGFGLCSGLGLTLRWRRIR